LDISVVLVEPEHQGNIGSVARVMKNFGFGKLCLVSPKTIVGDEARSLAAHATDVLEMAAITDTLDEALKGVSYVVGTTSIMAKRPANVTRIAITPEEFARKIREVDGKVALLFGRESAGLSNTELGRCDFVVTVPTDPSYRALNLAVAVAIVLYEIHKNLVGVRAAYALEAAAEDKSRLIRYFGDLLEEMGFPEYRRRIGVRTFRNLIGRAFISKREATILMGVYRKTLLVLKVRKSERGHNNAPN